MHSSTVSVRAGLPSMVMPPIAAVSKKITWSYRASSSARVVPAEAKNSSGLLGQ
jgi:hypothetical protein